MPTDVIEAHNGHVALELACYEHPDIILLDVMMPIMDGFEVLKRLRENPATEAIPVVMLTALEAVKGELEGISLGATHYITKPWEPGMVESAIRASLREAGDVTGGGMGGDASTVIRTGNMPLDQTLSGGIPLASLSLVEGLPSGGESVLCQHLTYESLLDGHGVVYYTSEYTAKSLITQMGSLGRDVSDYVREGRLGVYPIEEPTPSGGAEHCEDPERLMALLARNMEGLPRQYKIIIVDSITDLASHGREEAVMSFFSSCKRLSEEGRTIIVVARGYAFDEKMLNRLEVLCDAHLNLRAEKIGAKMVKLLEVRKVHNAEISTGNMVSFEVVPGIGLRIVPGAKVRV